MTLDELIAQARGDADDAIEPYLFPRTSLVRWFNEAVEEACIRGRLIHESALEAVCRIGLEPGRAVYPLHRALYEISHVAWRADGAGARRAMELCSTELLDRTVRDWRDLPAGRPLYAVQGDTSIRLVPAPAALSTLMLEGYRLPIEPMSQGGDEPEISSAHHRLLVLWVLWRAFSTPDTDFYDMDRARVAEAEFTRYFGPRPDSDLRRITREDAPHHVTPFFV